MAISGNTLTFHCGLPKTGSTLLQAEIFPCARGGTYIPGKLSLSYVIDPLSCAEGPVLISDERFTWAPLDPVAAEGKKRERMLAYLAWTWPQSNLLLFLREPSEMLRSYYAQYLHDGGFRTFEGFREHHFHAEAFRFDLLLDSIADMPWRDVLLIDYRDLLERPERAIKLVEAFTGIRFPGWQRARSSKRRNRSVSGYGARLLRSGNAFMLRGYPEHGMGLPDKVIRRRQRIRKLIQHGPLRVLNSFGPELMPRRELERIQRNFEGSWWRVQRRIAASQVNRLPESGIAENEARGSGLAGSLQ